MNTEHLTAADALIKRIETTKRTNSEIFKECDRYIGAALRIIKNDNESKSEDRFHILKVQLLALELAKIVPDLIVKVEKEAILSTGTD